MEKTFWTAAGLLYASAIVLLLTRFVSLGEGTFPWGFLMAIGLGTLAAALGNAIHASQEPDPLAGSRAKPAATA
jgi:hypothetical protein